MLIDVQDDNDADDNTLRLLMDSWSTVVEVTLSLPTVMIMMTMMVLVAMMMMMMMIFQTCLRRAG